MNTFRSHASDVFKQTVPISVIHMHSWIINSVKDSNVSIDFQPNVKLFHDGFWKFCINWPRYNDATIQCRMYTNKISSGGPGYNNSITMNWVVKVCPHFELERQMPASMWQCLPISWRHQMETFSALLALCAGNSPVTGEFPTQRPVTWSFDVFFDLRLNKCLSKQSRGWWFEMHCAHDDVLVMRNRQPMKYSCLKHTNDMDLKHLCNWLTQYTRQSRLIIMWSVSSQMLTMDTTSQTAKTFRSMVIIHHSDVKM